MTSARVAYSSRPDAMPEGEINALASVYRFVLDCHTKKKGTGPGGHDDAEESNDRTAEPKYNR